MVAMKKGLVALWVVVNPSGAWARQSFLPRNLATLSPQRREPSRVIFQNHSGSPRPAKETLPLFLQFRGGDGNPGGGDGGDESLFSGLISVAASLLDKIKLYDLLPFAVGTIAMSMSKLASKISILHVYDPSTAVENATENCIHHLDPLYGLDVSMQNFRTWVGYHLGDVNCVKDDVIKTRLYFRRLRANQKKLKALWLEGRLIRGRPLVGNSNLKEIMVSCCDLYIGILKDELEDDQDHSQLMTFLHTEYGPNITQLEATAWNQECDDVKLKILQDFLDWFRSTFPYYYDKCDACGASSPSLEETRYTFLGVSCPNSEEMNAGKASQVEFFRCATCGSVTRFPRFNSATSICGSRRGRCGEYNLLLIRMLQALGHTCRYLCDCGNGHVWSEVQWDDGAAQGNITNRRWLHLDPCEAAVNKNLLYQEWGRRLKAVFAFYAYPFDENQHNGEGIPVIEDVTDNYTSRRSWFRCRKKTIDKVSAILRDRISTLKEANLS